MKIVVQDNGKSFYKLTVKVRNKIVADGLDAHSFNLTDVGNHLTAEEWNAAMSRPDAVVVDMRNFYESEIGHFQNALLPPAHNFRQALRLTKEMLKGKEDKKILLYCTGGIRCEKVSAYLKHYGFKDVNQLYGGIIEYAGQVRRKGIPSTFIGKNFVFDERLGERITGEVISRCHQCGTSCDTHRNCANNACHLLFIQCEACGKKYKGCCSEECMQVIALPEEEQKKIGRRSAAVSPGYFPSRMRKQMAQAGK